jgi:hypothetical protein
MASGVGSHATGPRPAASVLGLRPATPLLMLAAEGFCYCVPMAMPQGHLVALCTDLGISASAGGAMLSMLLGLANLDRLGEHIIETVVLNYTTAYTAFGVKCLVAPEVPNNAGSLAPITVSAPEGSELSEAGRSIFSEAEAICLTCDAGRHLHRWRFLFRTRKKLSAGNSTTCVSSTPRLRQVRAYVSSQRKNNQARRHRSHRLSRNKTRFRES